MYEYLIIFIGKNAYDDVYKENNYCPSLDTTMDKTPN